MARPRSEDKQQALLDAATEIVSAQGLAAPTAQIARRAGVAEGTLFRYFPTKDDLLNALYLHLKRGFAQAITERLEADAPLSQRARAVWNGYIDWGIRNPAACRALNQLSVSDRIGTEARACAARLFPDMKAISGDCRFEGLEPAGAVEMADAMMNAIAQVTMSFAAAQPARANEYKAAGFEAAWRALNKA